MGQSAADIRPLLTDDEAKRLTDRLEEQLRDWRNVLTQVKQYADAGNPEAALATATERGVPIYRANARDADALTRIQDQNLERSRAGAASLAASSRWIALTLLGLGIAIGCAVLFVVWQTSRALQQASAELGESAGQVASAAGQVSASSQALAQNASEQAASLEETSASGEEITSMTRKNADNSRTAAELMVETGSIVGEANRTLNEMEVSMREINASSDRIGKIIKVIDEIAFQTNILALNAAVEAARAGEAGMGFAVVADEVRNLAQRSAQAAKDTAGMIEESITKSNEGRMKLDQVSTAIRSITESAQKVKTLVDEVKLGSEEQARGIEQISKAISQMEQVTQKSAANAEETASAGEEMSAQAEAMHAIVERLREMVGGGEMPRADKRHGERKPEHRAAAVHASPQRTAEGLRVLSTRVGRSAGAPVAHAVLSGAGKPKAEIPLDGEFKEF